MFHLSGAERNVAKQGWFTLQWCWASSVLLPMQPNRAAPSAGLQCPSSFHPTELWSYKAPRLGFYLAPHIHAWTLQVVSVSQGLG